MTELLANGDVPVRVGLADCGHRMAMAWTDAAGHRHGVSFALPDEWRTHLDREFVRMHLKVGERAGFTWNIATEVGEYFYYARMRLRQSGGSGG